MKPSIAEILRSIRPLPPCEKIDRLGAIIAGEPPRSIRRNELEEALRDIRTKQMRHEIKDGRRAARLAS